MITYIRLKGFHRFSLVGNHDFELTISEPMVVILGTNGSGKSALLSQLTPIPPSPTQFDKLGYKETHHRFRNKHYVLKAQFSPSARYYFSCDGVVLNDWGTQQIQKALVEEHFGLNQKTLALMQGSTLFSKMGPQERKDWIVALSGYDYDYAIKLYNRARDKQRDLEGAIRIATRRLALEVGQRVGEQEIIRLGEKARQLSGLLDDLYATRPRSDESSQAIAQRLSRLQQTCGNHISLVSKTSSQVQSLHYDEQQYLRWLEQIKIARSHVLSRLRHNEQEFSRLNRRIELFEKCSDASFDQLRQELSGYESQLARIKSKIDDGVELADLDISIFDRAADRLMVLLSDLPIPDVEPYSYKSLKEKNQALDTSDKRLRLLTAEQSKILASLEHMDEHKDRVDVTCPRCDHRHSSRYDPQQYVTQQQRYARLTEAIEQQTRTGEQLHDYVGRCSTYLARLDQWYEIKSHTRVFEPWWIKLEQSGIFHSESFNKSHWISDARKEIVEVVEAFNLQKKITEKRTLLSQLKAARAQEEHAGVVVLRSTRDEVAIAIERLTTQLDIFRQREELYVACANKQRQHRLAVEQLKRGTDDYEQLFEELNHARVCEYYQDVTRQLQLDLAQCAQAHHQAKSQEDSICALEKQIQLMREEENQYKLIIEELSPKSGLIAESLFGFIDQFFSDVNQFIEQVWTYPMRVLSRDPDLITEDIELDYRFPVEIIKNVRVLLKDVSHGDGASKGQKEMIDMAFLTTAMAHLQLCEFPLFLDEIGSSFDEEHKQGLIGLLKQILESKAFPQIFLVSHDFTQYTAVHAQTVVLDASNIRLK